MDYLVTKKTYSILLLILVIFIALGTDQLVKNISNRQPSIGKKRSQ
jgi:hypothetical protein